MFRRGTFRAAARLALVLVGAGALFTAHASDPYLLGDWTLNFISETPGSTSGYIYAGQPPGYAGSFNWNAVQTNPVYQSMALQTMCSSYNQGFNPGLNPQFVTTGYWLYGATATLDGTKQAILLGDGVTVVDLPSLDVPPETGASFLTAAELYATSAATATTNDAAAGLQLAIWDTLYGVAPTNMSAGIQAAYNNYIARVGTLTSADLINAQWYNYTGTDEMGQGQFGVTPEPFTLALGGSALLMALRRRRSRNV